MIKSLLTHRSLMNHLIFGFLVTSILPLAGFALFHLNNTENTLQKTVVNQMTFIAEKKANQFEDYVEDNRLHIRSLGYSSDVLQLFEELQKNYVYGIHSQIYQQTEMKARNTLTRITDNFPYRDLLLIDASGEVIFSLKRKANLASNVQTRPYHDHILGDGFQQSVNFLTTEITTFDVYDPYMEREGVYITTPLLKNNSPVGVLALQMNLENVYSQSIILEHDGLGESGEVVLVKESNDSVSFMSKLRYTANDKLTIKTDAASFDVKNVLDGKKGGGQSLDYSGRKVLAAWHYLPSLHWGIVVKTDEAEVFAPFKKLRFYTFSTLGFLTLLVTTLAFFISKSVVDPLHKLVAVTNKIAQGDLDQRASRNCYDEFSQLAETFNYMTHQIKRCFDRLDNRVKSHSTQLVAEKEKSEETLNQLKATQDDLVQAEKMASLGSLVAGVAHEINTPMGITLTAATHLNSKTEKIAKHYESSALDDNELSAYFKLAQKSTQLITVNSQRAADLIHGFKQIAVDQSSDERREFELKHYIEEVLLSLNATLKRTSIDVELNCPEGLILNTYAGAIAQILTNFVMNALLHAYEPDQKGVLSIRVTQLEHDLIELIFADNGKGIPKEIQSKVFDPFFTTQRGSGGSGLGLHVVYNLVHQTLKGSLALKSSPKGTTFIVQFPRV